MNKYQKRNEERFKDMTDDDKTTILRLENETMAKLLDEIRERLTKIDFEVNALRQILDLTDEEVPF